MSLRAHTQVRFASTTKPHILTNVVATGVVLNKGGAYALQIDGLITLTADGSFNGNAIVIENASDVEVFSSNGLGAINGQGYITRINSSGQNARLLRFISCSYVSIHDIIFVDSPTFHLVFNTVSNLEAYHITIRGPSKQLWVPFPLICLFRKSSECLKSVETFGYSFLHQIQVFCRIGNTDSHCSRYRWN